MALVLALVGPLVATVGAHPSLAASASDPQGYQHYQPTDMTATLGSGPSATAKISVKWKQGYTNPTDSVIQAPDRYEVDAFLEGSTAIVVTKGVSASASTTAYTADFSESDLTRGRRYYFRVRLYKTSLGYSAPTVSPAVLFGRRPAAPTGVTARWVSSASGTSYVVSWLPPSEMGDYPFVRYRVNYFSTSNNFTSTYSVTDLAATSVSIPAPTAAGPFLFTVTVITSLLDGVTSSVSNSAQPDLRPPILPPVNLTAFADAGTIKLSYTEANQNPLGIPFFQQQTETGYVVETSQQSGDVTTVSRLICGCGTRSSPLSPLTKPPVLGVSYKFRIAVVTDQGVGTFSDWSVPLLFGTLPTAPVRFTAQGSYLRATLTWSKDYSTTLPALKYKLVRYATDNTTLERIVEQVQPYSDYGVILDFTEDPGVWTYTIAVQTIVGWSPPSAMSSSISTVTGAPAKPTDLKVETLPYHQVRLSFVPPVHMGGSPLLGYQVGASFAGTPYVVWRLYTTASVGADGRASFVVDGSDRSGDASNAALISSFAYDKVGTFEITTKTAKGESNRSNVATGGFYGPPAAPTNVSAQPGDASVVVSWPAPTGYTADTYRVQGSAPGHSALDMTVTGGTRTATFSGLNNGTTYTFTVTARNQYGWWSDPSAPVSAAPRAPSAPGAPTSPSAVRGDGSATVSWVAPTNPGTSPITGYTVIPYIAGVAQSPVGFNSTVRTQQVTGLTNGTAYTFTVAAWNAVGRGPQSVQSASVTPVVPRAPGQPVGVTATAFDGSATVSWSPPADPGTSAVTRYEIRTYGGGSGLFASPLPAPISVSSSARGVTIGGLDNLYDYWFTVTAYSADGGGASAVSASITPKALTPPAVRSITAVVPGDRSVTVSWSPIVDDVLSAVTSFTIIPYIGTVAQAPTVVPSSAHSAVISGLTNGTAYTFTLAATNGVGSGPASAASAVVIPRPPRAPSAPTVTLAVPRDGAATVSWNAPADPGTSPVSGYVITPYLAGAKQSALVQTVAVSPRSATVGGLVNRTEYTFTVAAISAAGAGAESLASGSVTPHVPGRPRAPAITSVVAGDGRATITWTAPADDGGSPITSYVVRTFAVHLSGFELTVAGSVRTATVDGLTNDPTYPYGLTVQAVNSLGPGESSFPSGPVFPRAPVPPGAPVITSVSAGDSAATVAWATPTDLGTSPITGYVVTPYVGDAAQPDLAKTVSASGRTATVTGLTNGTAYTFTVAAISPAGTGASSERSLTVTPRPPRVPGVPSITSVTAGDAAVTVAWNTPVDPGTSPITGYRVTPYVGGVKQATLVLSVGTSPRSATVAGLVNGTEYTFTVAAINAVGTGGESAASTPVTPRPPRVPGVPSITSVAAGDAAVTVAWNTPVDPGTSPITGYRVTPYVGGVKQATLVLSVGTSPRSATVAGLVNGTEYTFTVAAINAVGTGGESAASTPVTPRPPRVPGVPSITSVAAGDAAVTVAWNTPVDPGTSPITGYRVTPYVGGVKQATLVLSVGTSPRSATVAGLVNGTEYTFTVAAINAVGTGGESAASTPVTPRPPRVPGVPSITSVAAGDAAVTVAWNTPVDPGTSPITGYRVTPYVGGVKQATLVLSVGTSPRSATVAGLVNGTEYTFTVAAINAVGTGGESAASTPVTPRPPRVPGVPSITSVAAGDAAVTVAWNTPVDPGTSPITGYRVTPYVGGVKQATLVLSVGTSPRSATVAGLVNGTEYTFTVAAINAVGTGGESAASTPVTPRPPRVPGVPSITSVAAGDAAVTVAWNTPVDPGTSPITGYRVTPYVGGVKQATLVLSVGTSPRSATVAGLVNGTEYTFTVAAINAVGTGGESAASTPVTPRPPRVPGVPSITSVAAGDAAVTVAWNTPVDPGTSPITGYRVTPYVGGVKQATLVLSVGASPRSATVAGLVNGTEYTFTVAAINPVGTGGESAASAAVTPRAPTVPGAPSITSVKAGNGVVTVAWNAPVDPGTSPITSYVVTPYVGGAKQAGLVQTVGTSPRSAVIAGLANGTAYTFTVAAVSAVGTGVESASSAAVTPVGVPGAPNLGSVQTSAGQVSGAFVSPLSNGGSPITKYVATASYDGAVQATIDIAPGGDWASVMYATFPAVPGKTFTLTVQAVNAAGPGPIAQWDPITVADPPGVPGNVTAVAGDRSATVSWTAPASGGPVAGYVVTPNQGSTAQWPQVFSGTDTTATVVGLTNGLEYTFTVHAYGGPDPDAEPGAESDPSDPVTPAVALAAPSAPTNVTAVAGDGQATVSWTTPASDGGSPILVYGVLIYAEGVRVDGQLFVGSDTTGTVTGLTNGVEYTFTVTAVNDAGLSPESTPSAAVTPSAPVVPRLPGAPAVPAATAGDGAATVAWQPPADPGTSPVTGYVITPYLGGAKQASLVQTATASPVVVSGLTNGTQYTFTVAAVNPVGTGAESAASDPVTPAGVPDAPNLGPVQTGFGLVGGAFTAPLSDGGSPVTNYVATASYDGAVQATIDVAPGGDWMGVMYATFPAVAGKTFTLTVRAVNASGPGPISQWDPITVPDPPGVPGNVIAVAGDGGATVSWAAPSGGPIAGYVVTPYEAGMAQSQQVFSGTDTSQAVVGLTNGVEYTFTVHAYGGPDPDAVPGAESDPSNPVTPRVALAAPSVPTNVSAVAGDGQATVSWTAPASDGGSGILGYAVTPYVGGVALAPQLFAGLDTTATVTGLTNDVEYTFTITAANNVGFGAESTASAPVTPTP